MEALNDQNGRMPMQPDGSIRVWRVNSFVRLLVHGGEFSEDVAQTAGYRMPSAKNLKTSLQLGLWVAVVDYDAVVSVPGVSQKGAERFAGPDGKVVEGSQVMKNATALGRMFKELFGACSVAEGPVEA